MYTLVIGSHQDVVIRHFFRELCLDKNPYVIFINVNQIDQTLKLNEDCWMLPDGGIIPHHQVQGAYNRLLSKQMSTKLQYLNWLLDYKYPIVINRPKDMMHNFSKLWQLHFIQEAGFLVPQSQVLANYRCDQGIGDKIFKSISSHRSIVEKVRNNHRRQVHEPVLFQQDCGRHNVRVHVLDQYTFAHHIVSKQVDYRYDTGSKMLDYQLTQQMQQKFVDLAQSLHLRFAGIDLMIEENKEYVLEVNPSPGYAYYEVNMASNIMTQTLIKALGLHV